MNLAWHGPFSFRDLILDPANRERFDEPGVYLWVERAQGRERLIYVGRALGRPTLLHRQVQHYQCYIGGLYHIPAEFRRSRTAWDAEIENAEWQEAAFRLDRFIDVVGEGFRYAETLAVHLAPCPRAAKAVEGNLIYDLRPADNKPGKARPPDERLRVIHQRAAWATPDVRQQIRPDVLFSE